MSKTANSNEARAPLTSKEQGRNQSVAAALVGICQYYLFEAGTASEVVIGLGVILMAGLTTAGNLLRNVAEHNKFARWLG